MMEELNDQQKETIRTAVKFIQAGVDNIRAIDSSQRNVGSEAYHILALSLKIALKYGLFPAQQVIQESEEE